MSETTNGDDQVTDQDGAQGSGDDGTADGESAVAAPQDEPESDDQSADHTANYVGVDTEYQQSATDSGAPLNVPDEMSRRVQEHMERMAQPEPGTESFADWAKRRRGE